MRFGPWFSGLRHGAGALLLAVAGGGTVLRIMGGFDLHPLLAAWRYATPWLVVGILAALGGLLVHGWIRRAWILVAAGIGLAIGSGRNMMLPVRPADAEGVRVVYWNTGGPYAEWDALGAWLQPLQADVVVLGETQGYAPQVAAFQQKWFPGFQWRQAHDNILVGSRFPFVREPQAGLVSVRHRYSQWALEVEGRAWNFLAVDLDSSPWVSRVGILKELAENFLETGDDPGIWLGDFNTPADARAFAPLRRTHVHAMETAGSGWTASWPFPVPVLQLDHAWSRHLRIVHARFAPTRYSDHAALVVQFTTELEGSAGPR